MLKNFEIDFVKLCYANYRKLDDAYEKLKK